MAKCSSASRFSWVLTPGSSGSGIDPFSGGGGFDVVFDTTGDNSGVETAVEHVRKGGQIVVVGLPGEPSEVFMTPVVRGEIDLDTSWLDLDELRAGDPAHRERDGRRREDR